MNDLNNKDYKDKHWKPEFPILFYLKVISNRKHIMSYY